MSRRPLRAHATSLALGVTKNCRRSVPTANRSDATPQQRTPALAEVLCEVSDGTRTRDRLDHNQELRVYLTGVA
jgi:hypothetical protein